VARYAGASFTACGIDVTVADHKIFHGNGTKLCDSLGGHKERKKTDFFRQTQIFVGKSDGELWASEKNDVMSCHFDRDFGRAGERVFGRLDC
jgi:hypothetical protein